MKREPNVEEQEAGGQRHQTRRQREQHRGGGAEDEGQDDDRDRDADQLADRGGRLLGLVDDRAAAGDLEPGRARRSRSGLESLARARAAGSGGPVVLDGGEGDPAVARELRFGAPVTCGWRSTAFLVCAIAACPPVSVDREDDGGGVAGLRREAFVSRSIAFWDSVPGVGKVDERAAGGGAARRADEDDGDDGERALPLSRGRGGETSEGCAMGYRIAHSVRNCNGCRIASCADCAGLESATMKPGAARAQEAADARAIVTAAFALFDERGSTRRRSPTSPRRPTSPRAPSSPTSPRRRPSSSTTSTGSSSAAGAAEARPEGETAIDALRTWLEWLEATADLLGERGTEEHHGSSAATTPSASQAREQRPNRARFEAPDSRRASRPTSTSPPTACGRGWSARPPSRRWRRSTTRARTRPQSMRVLDEALIFLRGGVAALQESGRRR